MNVITDTHAIIWFITDNDKLSSEARKVIKSTSNICYVSIASLWEMGIKSSLGKLELKVELEQIFKLIDQSGFALLSITPAHVLMNTRLEFYHRDPFDRLIIAQAKVEDLAVITKDGKFKKYDIELVWD